MTTTLHPLANTCWIACRRRLGACPAAAGRSSSPISRRTSPSRRRPTHRRPTCAAHSTAWAIPSRCVAAEAGEPLPPARGGAALEWRRSSCWRVGGVVLAVHRMGDRGAAAVDLERLDGAGQGDRDARRPGRPPAGGRTDGPRPWQHRPRVHESGGQRRRADVHARAERLERGRSWSSCFLAALFVLPFVTAMYLARRAQSRPAT